MSEPIHILLVEDEAAHAELVQRAFEMRGDPVRLDMAGTLAEARAHLDDAARPDLIIADWRLPDGEGIELLSAGSDPWATPVVIMTSHGNERVAVDAMKAGALDYVVKSEATLLDMPHIATRAIREWSIRAEQVRTAQELRESEARFRLLAENSTDLISRYDPRGLCLYASPACFALLGYTPEELVGRSVTKVIHPADLDEALTTLARLPYQSGVYTLSLRIRRKDGRYIWSESMTRPIMDERTGAIVEIQASSRDITRRKEAEEQISQLNADLERRARSLAAINHAGQLMASTLDRDALLARIMEQVKNLMDVEGASVLLCDPPPDGQDALTGPTCPELVFAAVTGAGSDKLLGLRVPSGTGIAAWVLQEKHSALIHDVQSDPRFYNAVDFEAGTTTRSMLAVPLLTKGAALGVLEAINKRSGSFDGHDLEVLESICNSAAIAIENARLYATEQERTAALARALERQQELDRLQREFIQNVSHELRTPLALIQGHAEVLENGWLGDLQASQLESVNVISRRAHMLRQLVDDIVGVLTLERRELKQEPVDMSQLVQVSCRDFKANADKAGLALMADIAPEVPYVLGDPLALRRVLDNLLSNAFKFTPKGGRVTARLSQDSGTVVMAVSDTGIGIPNDKLGRIFERFYQVDGSATRQYGGVGLGLALVKEIVEAHGGRMAVSSQVGEGATFTILLPAHEG